MKTPHRKTVTRKDQSDDDLSPEQLAEFEKSFRAKLERQAEEWEAADRLRRFVDACQNVFHSKSWERTADDFEKRWSAWARAHADRRDPLRNGYLHAELMRDILMRARAADVEHVRKRMLEILDKLDQSE